MVLIGGEAFVYILIICIRLNRNYHLKLTNGEQGSLGRESGTQQQWWDHGQTLFNQMLGTSLTRGSQNSWGWRPSFQPFLEVLAVHLVNMSWLVPMRVTCSLPHVKEERCLFEISTQLNLAPLSLWGLLDLVTPLYAPQQMTTPLPIWFFPF